MERPFRVDYYSPRVREEIESRPVDLLARCDELLDLRPRGRSGIGRAFYGFCSGRVIIVLHAFVKKTQKTPRRDLLIAQERLKNVKRHG